MASPDSNPEATANPLDAMALAPAEALIEPKRSLPAAQPATRPAKASAAEKTDKEGAKPSPSKAGSTKPICGESFGEAREGDCIRVRIVRVRPSTAVNAAGGGDNISDLEFVGCHRSIASWADTR